MTSALSRRVRTYLVVAACGLLAGVAFHRIDLVALGAPFALVAVAGLATARRPVLDVSVGVERERAVEGDELRVEVRLTAPVAVDRVELVLDLPDGVVSVGPDPLAVAVVAGEPRVVALSVRCERWGTYDLGAVLVRVRDPSGTWTWIEPSAPTTVVRVRPAAEVVESVVRPHRTRMMSGNQVAAAKGAGIEPADLRAFGFGDQLRDVNWRAKARRGELWVNDRHPERATDVVVFLDAFSAGGFDRAVRAAVTLVEAHIGQRDRVGLVTFGGTVSWVRPGMGAAQQTRIVDHLLGRRVLESFVWKGINVVPPGTLPPRSLVLAVTPLEDERTLAGLADLRNRGIDVALIEVAPTLAVDAADPAARLWRLRRDVVRDRFRRLGVAAVEWPEDRSVESVLAEAAAFRRLGRRMVR